MGKGNAINNCTCYYSYHVAQNNSFKKERVSRGTLLGPVASNNSFRTFTTSNFH